MDEQQAVMEYLRTLGIDTPEALQEFALTGQTPTMLGMAGQDYETGLGLSQTPSAEGQRVGGTYVAANPLEHLAAAMSRVQGGRQMQGARSQQNALVQALAKANAQKIRGEAGGMQPQPEFEVPQSPQPIDQMWPGFPYPMP
jgi:hypothetical protein